VIQVEKNVKITESNVSKQEKIIEKKDIKLDIQDPSQKVVEYPINTPEFILNKIINNSDITSYLEKKYNNVNLEDNLEKFQKSIGST
jgi:hypothetical protein